MALRLLTYPYSSVRARALAGGLLAAGQVDELLGSVSTTQAELLLEQWLGVPRGSGERGGYVRFFAFASEVARALPAAGRAFVTAYMRRGEVENLKLLCRSLLTGRGETVSEGFFPPWPPPLLPSGVATARSLDELTARLPRGPLRDLLLAAGESPPTERLFRLETSLERWYWDEVLAQARRLPHFDRLGIRELLALRVDIDRLRVIGRGLHAELPAGTILGALPPHGSLFFLHRVRRALASEDPASALASLFPTPLADPFVSAGEVSLLRRLHRELNKTLRSAPFDLTVPFSALLLAELELRDIAAILGALRVGVAKDEALSFLCSRGG